MKSISIILEEFVEKGADLEHDRWLRWQKWCHKVLRENCLSSELEIECKKCGKNMKCLGHIDGLVYLTYPEQWDEVYICDTCKTKQTVREHSQLPPDYSYIKDYEDQNNIST